MLVQPLAQQDPAHNRRLATATVPKHHKNLGVLLIKALVCSRGSVPDLNRIDFRVTGSRVRDPQNKICTGLRQRKYLLSPCYNIGFLCSCPGFRLEKNCFDIFIKKAAWEERRLFVPIQEYSRRNRNEWPKQRTSIFHISERKYKDKLLDNDV